MFKSKILVFLFIVIAVIFLPLKEFAQNKDNSAKLSVVNTKSLASNRACFSYQGPGPTFP